MIAALTAKKIPDTVDELGRWLNGIVYRFVRARSARGASEDLVDAVACLDDPTYDFDPPNAARDDDS